jgi:DNA-binding NarL/FixJ family response regulator
MEYIDKALVVDSNPIYREGLKKVLSEAFSVDCLGFASIDLMLGSATGECERALLLLDFGGNCVIAANCIGHLRNKFPQSLVVVMSELYNDDHILCAFIWGPGIHSKKNQLRGDYQVHPADLSRRTSIPVAARGSAQFCRTS